MKPSTRTPTRCLRLSWWWLWIPLVPLLADGCDGCKAPGPRELVCRPIAYYEVLDPTQGAGAAPFSIERLGPQLKEEQVELRPDLLTFMGENRVATSWWALGHIYGEATVIYSPAEGLARGADDPERVYPMKLFSDGKSERLRFGFRSQVCRKPNEHGSYYGCKRTEDELYLVADMTCRWELIDPREWE